MNLFIGVERRALYQPGQLLRYPDTLKVQGLKARSIRFSKGRTIQRDSLNRINMLTVPKGEPH